ncbi:MAG TPA: D-alanyl-D-alanine carboxypeptidase/D-alanyl-D-alanine-endopeptidase [Fimbriimonadaceae bacterium]|jgi:D-alanyl-D-alanine carboxypeptidase/D-alanyl-D-alanine-endopeptidase (penicillin-binding protein 4)
MLAYLVLAHQLATADLDAILQSPLVKGSSYAAYVTKLDGSVIYDHNSGLRLLPASNEKLFTAAYALQKLGTDYHPTTRFWKLPDRVVVDTTGDPMLTYADLTHAKDELKLTGKDPVYVHEPYRIGYPSQWEVKDLPNKYAAAVTGFTVDRGGFEIWADKDHPYLMPSSYGVKIVHTGSGSRHVHYEPFTKTVHVYGNLPSTPVMLDTLSVPDPDKAAASILGDEFHPVEATPTSPPDLVLEGPVLPMIVKECLVHSDNNLAENLLMLAAIKQGDLGDDPYETATARERSFCTTTLGIDPSEFRPDDGCGLSRHNMVTARAIAKVLQWESAQPTFDMWKQSLASPGNGTLKERLKNSTFVGKTGTMEGVSALSGYVNTKDGQTVIVSMLFNHHLCPNSQIRGIQDSFIKKIEASSLSGTLLEDTTKRESLISNSSARTVSADRLH